MVCAHGTTLGIQVPPAARTEMEAFKERSLYAQIHARQAEDYQACAYYLPLTSLLTSFLTSFPRGQLAPPRWTPTIEPTRVGKEKEAR